MKRGRPTTGREPFRCTAELRTGRCPSRVIRVGHDREDTAGYVRFAPKADKRADVSLSPLSADFVAEVAEEGGRLCLGAEHEP